MEYEKKTELLRQGWKEVFEVDDVSDDADFFEAGGDSIKAVQLSAWLLQKGLKLDLGRIFYTPVFSQMAETLEETDPVFVPDQLMTKELAAEKREGILAGRKNARATASEAGSGDDQQVCDPEHMGADGGQQICDPERMAAYHSQQICDPERMAAYHGQQICDPDRMAAYHGQQICDPDRMGMNHGQPAVGFSDPFFNMMTSMFQTMLSQQQVMLQMMQLMMNRMTPPYMPPQRPAMPTVPRGIPFPAGKGFHAKKRGKRAFNPAELPPEVRAELWKQMKQYEAHKVDKPIEKPNVIGLKKAKVGKPVKSPEEVLDHVLGGLLKKGFSKTDDLFEQGLTSLDTVKMVTRCAEYGYALSMQDIYMHSNYNELIKCMKPGE